MEKPLHIGIFFSALSGGGAQRRSLLLARGFAARGCRVDIAVVREDGPFRHAIPSAARLFSLESRITHWPVIRSIKGL